MRLLPHGLRFEMIRQRLHAGLVLAAAQPQVLVGRGERRLGQPDFELRFVEVVRRLRRFELQQLAAVETLRLRLLEPRRADRTLFERPPKWKIGTDTCTPAVKAQPPNKFCPFSSTPCR